MYKVIKLLIFILIVLFVLGFCVYLITPTSNYQGKELDIADIPSIPMTMIPKKPPVVRNIEEPTIEVTLEQTVEPLTGKDLYISYIKEIIDEYYSVVDPYIVLAVMETESNYQPNVKSSAGAVGLMQVIPKYHQWRIEKYGLVDIWDPYANILCGIDLLNELYFTYNGDWSKALFGYNHSTKYVNYILFKANELRGGNYFGEATGKDTGGP